MLLFARYVSGIGTDFSKVLTRGNLSFDRWKRRSNESIGTRNKCIGEASVICKYLSERSYALFRARVRGCCLVIGRLSTGDILSPSTRRPQETNTNRSDYRSKELFIVHALLNCIQLSHPFQILHTHKLLFSNNTVTEVLQLLVDNSKLYLLIK